MSIALVAINEATYGGVYYCANFTTSGAQPTWARLTTTGLPSTQPDIFRVDYGDPINTQYLGFGCVTEANGKNTGAIYRRQGGNWSKIMDVTMAQAYLPLAQYVSWLWTDPTQPGRVFTIVWWDGAGINPDPGNILVSQDYGNTWVVKNIFNLSGWQYVEAIGNYIWVGCQRELLASARICASSDFGTSWDDVGAFSGLAVPAIRVNPVAPTTCLVWVSGLEQYATISGGIVTVAATNMVSAPGEGPDSAWFDLTTSGECYSLVGGTLYYTTDNWANVSNTVIGTVTQPRHITKLFNEVAANLLMGDDSTLYQIDDATDSTPDDRSGTNHGSVPYTDALPGAGSIVTYGIWAGTAPATKGVYVYSVEMESADSAWPTDLADYTNIGRPMGGDRASFRDMPADGFDVYHAQDVHAATPQIHAPWDEAAPPGAGYGIISDGTKWEVSSGPIALTSAMHAAVTLDVDAAVILDLTGQEIGLDVQNANTVLAGPTTGAANEPTFRALGLTDLPAIALNDLSDVDTTGVDTGDILVKTAGGWEDRRQNIRKVVTITADTTLDDTYDVVIVDATGGDVDVTLPSTTSNDGLEYAIKRIDASANVVTVIANMGSTLTDSAGDPIDDSAGDPLLDSIGGAENYIDGETTMTIDQYSSMQIVADADADSWWIL